MRTEPFTKEIRRIRDKIDHAFHHPAHTQKPTQAGWHTIREKPASSPCRTIYDAMQKRPIAVRPESHLRRAVDLMVENDISGLPVVDAEGMIVGALNESDLLKVFYESGAANVASVMTRDPDVVSVRAPLVDVVDQLMSSDLRRVLVHDDGKLVGIVTRACLMPAILEAIEEEVGVRPAAWTHLAGSRTKP
jgi:CBS domain-containing protein